MSINNNQNPQSPQLPPQDAQEYSIPHLLTTQQTSPEASPKTLTRTRVLSPQTSKEKLATMLEKMELNTKYFPSKANVCKGENFDQPSQFSPPHSRSPIVAYYAGMTNSNPKYFSPDNNLNTNSKKEKNFYQFQINNFQLNNNSNSNQYQNFNFSPSAIFNVDSVQRNSENQTLQEKIEGNVNEGAKILMKNQKNVNSPESLNEIKEKKKDKNKKKKGEDKGKGSEEDNDNDEQGLYFLSYNDKEEELNDIKDMDISDSNDEGDKKDDSSHYMLDGYNSIEDNFVSSGLNAKLQMEHDRAQEKKKRENGQMSIPLNKNSSNNILNQNQNPFQTYTTKQNIVPSYQNAIHSENIKSIAQPQLQAQSQPQSQDHIINFYNNFINNYYYPNMGMNIPTQYNQYQNIQYPLTKPRNINSTDLITTTMNNKKIKRIDPSSYINESYEYLSHNIFLLAKDQAGCRFLQKKLEDDPLLATSHFYPSVVPYVIQLVRDSFGNYLIQKLCYTLTPDQIMHLLVILSPNILDIGLNSHGTRVIQHIINFLSTPQLIQYFVSIIAPKAIPLLKELNGTHIIQKFNTDFPNDGRLITLEVINNCNILAVHRHGCCVLQKYLEIKDIELKNRLIRNLIDISLDLVIDQFGNYVIQSILKLNIPQYSNEVAMRLLKDPPYYSKHKYSSNVIEKCFDFCDDKVKRMFIEVLAKKEIVTDLILNEHGNYVIQKVLECADKKTQIDIINYISPMISKIKAVSFGERIINKLITSYPQMASLLGKEGKKNTNKKNKKKNALNRNANNK